MSNKELEVYKSFDARDWASYFVECVNANPSIATDEGTMVAWFASALMRGYDERTWQTPEYKRMIRRVLRPNITERLEKVKIWISWHTPKWLAYWCCIRVLTKTVKDGPDDQISSALKNW